MDRLHKSYKGRVVTHKCSVFGCHGVGTYLILKPVYQKGGIICQSHRNANPEFEYKQL